MDNQTDGTVVAPDAEQENESSNSANEQRVNPGAIRKSQTAGILNALSAASGQQFDSVEAAIAYVARTSAQNSGGSEQPVVKQKQGRPASNDLAEQFHALQNKLAVQQKVLQEKEFETDVRNVMGSKFDPDLMDYAMSKVKSNIQWGDDGTYTIVNAKGQERYSQSGEPLTLSGLVEEVARSNPKLLKQSNQGGSGLRPGQGGNFAGVESDSIPDYSRDPAAFNAWAVKNGLGKNIGLKGMSVSAMASTSTRKLL
jgi:hypothetical protein